MKGRRGDMDMLTKLIHNASLIDTATGASSTAVYHASTFHQHPGETGAWVYSRAGNPTRQALEATIADLEQGSYGFAFASGMAAIAAVMMLFEQGDHVILPRDIYGGTFDLMAQLVARYGLQATYVDLSNLAEVEAHITPRTRGIYIETPSNPTLKITDLRGVADLAHRHGLITIADNTFMSPYLQRPLTMGIDIVVHSATKFLGGHSDVIAGLAVATNPELAARIGKNQKTWGGILGPDDSWLVLRGIKTLGVRMDRAQQNALYLANWFVGRQGIKQVYYPGLAHHPGLQTHMAQALGAGAVLSVVLEDSLNWQAFVEHLQYAIFAVSLGGVETIVSHPATMSHAAMPAPERQRRGVDDNLLRISVGIESINDLIRDFEAALTYVTSLS